MHPVAAVDRDQERRERLGDARHLQPPQSTQRIPGMSSTSDPTTAFASASSPITSASESTGRSSARRALAATVWNAAHRRTCAGRSVFANSAAEPCHGRIACDGAAADRGHQRARAVDHDDAVRRARRGSPRRASPSRRTGRSRGPPRRRRRPAGSRRRRTRRVGRGARPPPRRSRPPSPPSGEPIVTSWPAAASRSARPKPSSPVPPAIAIASSRSLARRPGRVLAPLRLGSGSVRATAVDVIELLVGLASRSPSRCPRGAAAAPGSGWSPWSSRSPASRRSPTPSRR